MKEDLMAAWVWIVVAIVVVAVVVLGAMMAKNRRTAMLRDRFGPEYDRAVASSDDKRAAETELLARQKQRAQFDIEPLPEADRLRFAGEWRDQQERFLDEPAQAVDAADALITRVMEARGYPMRDFDLQAELVSVDYPQTVENYRFAHAVQLRSQTQQAGAEDSQTQQAGTEELREAMLRYRSLFDELLRPEGSDAAGAADQVRPASPNGRHRLTARQEEQVTEDQVTENQVPEAGPTGQADDLAPGEDDALADPAASGADYRDQQIGR
jgi:hypothetical protein